MPTLNEASARLRNALAATRAAEANLATAALHLLCLQIKSAHGSAATVLLDWSDQGDWLAVIDVLDPGGKPVAWEDDDCLAANLEGHTEGVWLPFMSQPTEGALRQPTDLFHLPIAKTIAHFNRHEALR